MKPLDKTPMGAKFGNKKVGSFFARWCACCQCQLIIIAHGQEGTAEPKICACKIHIEDWENN